MAGADLPDATIFERLGFNLFTFAQLVYDPRDQALPEPRATDAELPAPATGRAYDSPGASPFVAILALAYLGRAHADLRLLAGRGHAVEALGRFLQRVESDSLGTGPATGA